MLVPPMGNDISYMYLVHDLKKYIPTAVLKDRRHMPPCSVACAMQ